MTDSDRIARLEALVAELLTLAVAQGQLPLSTARTIAELTSDE